MLITDSMLGSMASSQHPFAAQVAEKVMRRVEIAKVSPIHTLCVSVYSEN